ALLAEHLINGTPLVEGWFEDPTEVVTIENVDDYVSRQTDHQVQYDYYQQYIEETYGDLSAPARPHSDPASPGMVPPAPVPQPAECGPGTVAEPRRTPSWK